MITIAFFGLFVSSCSTSPEVEDTQSSVSNVVEEASATDIPDPTEIVPDPTDIVNEIDSIRVGVNANSIPPLTIIEGNEYSGFEIDVASEIVKRLYGAEMAIEWMPITSQERWSALQEGRIDMLVRSALHTVAREELVLFSGAYLLSGNGFLVFPERGFSMLADLNGENIATAPYLEDQLNEIGSAFGYEFAPVLFENVDDSIGALGFSRASATFNDWVLLTSYMDNSIMSIFTPESFLAPIGIAFALDNSELRDEVNTILQAMITDGTWQSIFDSWFEIEVLWDVNDMFGYPAK